MPLPIFDASADHNVNSQVTNTTFNFTVGNNPNRYLFYFVFYDNVSSAHSITAGGNAMTILATGQVSGTTRNMMLAGILSPTVGSIAIASSWTGGARVVSLAIAYHNVDQSNPVGSIIKNENKVTSPQSVNISVTSDVLGVDFPAAFRSGITGAPILTATGVNQTSRNTSSSALSTSSASVGVSDITGSGTVTSSWTIADFTDFGQMALPLRGVVSNNANFFMFM
jgi:hypothetical protein